MIRMIDTPIEIKPLTLNMEEVLTLNFTLAAQAWLNSRPAFKGSLEDIIKNDTPVADFVRIPLVFTIPNFIREIIVAPRDHVVWSSTTRANPVHEAWPVYRPDKYDYTEAANELLTLKAQGARQDEFRMVLPMGYCGIFSVNMSFRSLVKMYKFLLDLSAECNKFDPFIEVAQALRQVFVDCSYGNIFDLAVKYYESADFLPEFKYPVKSGFTKVGSLITWSGTTSLGLRTHIVRHRSVLLSDTIKSIYKYAPNRIPLLNLQAPVSIQATTNKDIWDHVISTRNCWIAQASIWQSMVNEYASFIGGERAPLPCDKENLCPFITDNELRIEGKDPNPVCPKYLKIQGKTVSDEVKQAIITYGDSRASWWRKES